MIWISIRVEDLLNLCRLATHTEMAPCTMDENQIPTLEVLPNAVPIRVNGEALDFETARALAEQHALVDYEEVMLLAWFDRKAQRYSPNIRHCVQNKPSWVVYAESRGGNISIDINEEQYVFIFYGKERT